MPRGTYLHLEDGTEERFQCAPGPGGWRYVASRTDGTRLDLVVDSRWRQIRVEIVTPDWWLRGGVTGHGITWVRATSSGQATEHSATAAGFLGDSPAFLIATAHHLTSARARPNPDPSDATLASTKSQGSAPLGNAPHESRLASNEASFAEGQASTPLAPEAVDEEPSEADETRAFPEGRTADLRLVRVTGVALATLTEAWRWRLASVTRHETETGALPVEQYETTDLATGEVHSVHLAGDVVLDAPGIELTELDTPPSFLTR
ncbi:hypothetical protein [Actinomadura logoneensis]|uniref:hypothetical protein n=1 Tax=Actinomadura logoneensis TaxID=2293572 RepID=UPI0018F1AB21|nr:hypothetical protein [Actinomadura logoneensis]